MKRRQAFVANSSSSSFLIMMAGGKQIVEAGSGNDSMESEHESIDINYLIEALQKAKEKGATKVDFEFGGGYDG